MRKVFLFILIFSLVLGNIPAIFAADGGKPSGEEEETAVENPGYEDAVSVLMSLGVVSGYEDGQYHPENIVTRAEMAVLIVRALGLENVVTDGTVSSFSDMEGYGWAEACVGYAQGLGIVSGYPDGTFAPGGTVSYNEAATMVVAALGYTPASLNGVWPVNYVSQAKALGILKGITASAEGANRGDVAIMLYQALNCKIGTVSNDGNWTDTGVTMLKRLGAKEANNGNAFVITDDIAKNQSLINLQDKLGAYVKGYVNQEDEVISVSEVKSTYLQGKVKSGYFNSSNTDYNYNSVTFENGSDSNGAYMFVNGEVTGYVASAAELGTKNVMIAAEVNGKTLKTIYSVSSWTMDSGEHGYFTEQCAQEIEKDHKLFGYKLPEDRNGGIDYNKFTLLGVETLEDLLEGDVLYMYYDKSKTVSRVTVGRAVVEGEVEKMSTDDDPFAADFTVGGKKYSFDTSCYDSNTGVPDTGDQIKAYLNYDGDFYHVEITDSKADNYAIVLEVSNLNLDSSLHDNRLRLFTADGEAYNYDVDSAIKVKVDGESSSNAEKDLLAMGAGDIIEYGLNKKGELNKVNIITTGKFTAENTVSNGKMTARGAFDGHTVSSSAIIFTVDAAFQGTGSGKAGDYGTGKLANLLDGAIGNAIYITDSSDKINVMLVDNSSSGGDDVYGVALAATKNTTDLGYERQFLVEDGRKTYNVSEDVAAAPNTELYRLIFNSSGEVTSLEPVAPVFEIKGQAADFGLKTSAFGITIGNPDVENENGEKLLSDPYGYLRGGDSASMDHEVFVYTRTSSSSRYAAGKRKDIDHAVNEVRFYSVCEGGVIDYVLVNDRSGGSKGSASND